jgi:uncharacterized membrane protein YbhN (UPF0104 family)
MILLITSGSLLVWLSALVINLCLLWAFDIQPLLPAALLILVFTNLGMILPSAPGYIGVYHYLTVLALGIVGVPASTALTFAVVAHALQFGTLCLGGVISIAVAGLDWRTLRFQAESHGVLSKYSGESC